MIVSVSPVFNRAKYLNKQGKALIHIYILFDDGSKDYVNTKIRIAPDEWSNTKQCVIKRNDSRELNKKLSNVIGEINAAEMKLQQHGQNVTRGTLKDMMGGKDMNKFSTFMDNVMSESYGLTPGTLRAKQQTVNAFNDFNPSVSIGSIDYSMVKAFDNYLIKRGLNQNTRYKHHKDVKAFLNEALKMGYLNGDISRMPYKHFKIRQVKGRKRALSWSQFQKIADLNLIGANALNYTKELFMVGCYTGLRFQDVQRISSEFITNDGSGRVIAYDRMIKTPFPVRIPIDKFFSGAPGRLLDKYPDNQILYKGRSLPNQEVNRMLKIIQTLAGIDQSLSFHVSRHSFLTWIASLTGSEFSVMKYGGIMSSSTARIYIDLANEMMDKAIQNVDWDFSAQSVVL